MQMKTIIDCLRSVYGGAWIIVWHCGYGPVLAEHVAVIWHSPQRHWCFGIYWNETLGHYAERFWMKCWRCREQTEHSRSGLTFATVGFCICWSRSVVPIVL